MDKMEVGFFHGALCESYEKQANDQGFTLGDSAEKLQKCGTNLVHVWIEGLLTDSQYDKALHKLQKKLLNALKPISKEDDQE